ncbi:MAG: sugar transferase, partial [Pseudomonadota bacterium]
MCRRLRTLRGWASDLSQSAWSAAIGGLFVLFPVIALTCIAIRMESAGPAIFRQQRVGRAERPFTVYKLRTMRIGT